MADLTIDLSSIRLKSNSIVRQWVCGESIDAGAPVFIGSDSELYECDATDDTRLRCVGVALLAGEAGDYVSVIQPRNGLSDVVQLVASGVVRGTTYVVSATRGIAPLSDLVDGQHIVWVGVGSDDGRSLQLVVHNTGQSLPAATPPRLGARSPLPPEHPVFQPRSRRTKKGLLS